MISILNVVVNVNINTLYLVLYSLHAKRPLIVACTVNSLFVGNPGSDTFVLFFEISVSDGNIDIGFFS